MGALPQKSPLFRDRQSRASLECIRTDPIEYLQPNVAYCFHGKASRACILDASNRGICKLHLLRTRIIAEAAQPDLRAAGLPGKELAF